CANGRQASTAMHTCACAPSVFHRAQKCSAGGQSAAKPTIPSKGEMMGFAYALPILRVTGSSVAVPFQKAHLLARQMIGKGLAERRQRAVLLFDQRDLPGEIRIADAPRAQAGLGGDLTGGGRQ